MLCLNNEGPVEVEFPSAPLTSSSFNPFDYLPLLPVPLTSSQ